jgi:hypothetical protein
MTGNLIRDHKEHQDLKDPLACLEKRASLDYQVLKDNEVSLENEERRVKLEFPPHHQSEVFLVKLVFLVWRETVELLESLVWLDCKESVVRLERSVSLVSMVQEDHLDWEEKSVWLDHLVATVFLDCKVLEETLEHLAQLLPTISPVFC